MTISYVKRSFWWLPRVNGGLAGTYAHEPPEGFYYYTDLNTLIPTALDNGGSYGLSNYYKWWTLPPWFPQKALLKGVQARFGCSNPQPGGVSIDIYIDIKGIGYKTGTPPGAEVGEDFTRDISLMQWWVTTPVLINSKSVEFDMPIPFDRTQGDHLVFDTAHGTMTFDWLSCIVDFLVPATFQPTALGPGY